MKKFTILLTIIMTLTFCVPCFAEETANLGYSKQQIKVGLFYASAAKETIDILSDGSLKLYDSLKGTDVTVSEDGLSTSDPMIAQNNKFTFYVSNSKLVASDGKSAYIIEHDAILRPVDGFVKVGNKKYRGHIILKVDNNQKITVINEVDLDEYLYGVLPYEMSTGFPYEALKAQAVCARTYALNSGSKFKEYGFDLTDNTLSQVYNGINGEADDCTQAVIDTIGDVIKYDGKLAETFYYASSSGETLDVKDVWGSTTYPYLISVPDTYQSVIYPNGYTWTVEYSKDEIAEMMNKKGLSLGNIKDITIDKTTPQGAVTSLTFVGENDSKTYTLGNTRTALGLKSQVFTISKEYAENNNQTYYITSSGVTSSENQGYVISADGTKKANKEYAISSSGITEVDTSSSDQVAEKYIISGSGYGHGIGMSQNGAKGMAKSGFTYDQILTHYFPGCTVENILPPKQAVVTEEATEENTETNSGEF